MTLNVFIPFLSLHIVLTGPFGLMDTGRKQNGTLVDAGDHESFCILQ